jgi:hypothetical protein
MIMAGLATPTRGGEVSIAATYSGFADCDNGWYYTKSVGFLYYGLITIHAPWDYRAFVKFTLDSVPDSCILRSVELNYYQFEHSSIPAVGIKLIGDPEPLGASELFHEIDGATPITPTQQRPDGWVAWTFDSAALTRIDSCRSSGSVSFAIDHDGGDWCTAQAYGYTDSMPPILHVEYGSLGSNEEQGITVAPQSLGLKPNPTRSAPVTVTCHSTILAQLIIRDASGRTARSFALDRSGVTEIDLCGLAPGVYMATLDAGSQSLTRKLVIPAR